MTDAPGGLEQALCEAAASLESASIPYMLIGGLALAAWDLPRATLDVDLTVWVPDANLDTVCALLATQFRARVGDPAGFARKSRVLPLTSSGGIRIDIVFAAFPFERTMIQRAVRRQLAARAIPVASLEDLILLKVVSPREKDSEDIRLIANTYRPMLDWTYILSLGEDLAEALENQTIVKELHRLKAPDS